MQLAAPHQAPRDVGGLQRRAFGRRMGGEIAGDRNEDVPAREIKGHRTVQDCPRRREAINGRDPSFYWILQEYDPPRKVLIFIFSGAPIIQYLIGLPGSFRKLSLTKNSPIIIGFRLESG
jgi:hypothetical protein